MHKILLSAVKLLPVIWLPFVVAGVYAQQSLPLKYKKSAVYAGIEVGSKGVKVSFLEIGKNARQSGAYNVVKDTSINTDFISFTDATTTATLNALVHLYKLAAEEYKISSEKIFTVISSGVKMQAEKEKKADWISKLVTSFRNTINEPNRQVELVDVTEEARLSHLGIIPNERRLSSFLIDIGSGNSKGGYFPNEEMSSFKLFQLSWGTKSIANVAEKKCGDDLSLANFQKQLQRLLIGTVNDEISYAVNLSNAYSMSDNIAVSGGAAWAVATLLHPELIGNPVVPVTYTDIEKLYNKIYRNFTAVSDEVLVKNIPDNITDKKTLIKEIKRVHQVFDQRSLLAAAGLLLRIMRQFEGGYEQKQFFLVKTGQVGWISAYVNQNIER